MNKYPEWFIGGPLDGQDKTEILPNAHFGVRYDERWTFEDFQNDPEMDRYLVGEVKTAWHYSPQRFTFGGIVITFWADSRYMSREIIALRLAEMIMAPHVKENKTVGSEKVNLVKGAKP